MALINNDYNIKVGDTQIAKVMCGDFQVWPWYNPPEPPPHPTTCIPASAATANAVKYASEIVPYGEYVLRWNNGGNNQYCKNDSRRPFFDYGTDNLLTLVAVPKADIPAVANEPIYGVTGPGDTGLTYYEGCAYALMDKLTGKYLYPGVMGSDLINANDHMQVLIDYFDSSINHDGSMLGFRIPHQTDPNGYRLCCFETQHPWVSETPQYYNDVFPYNYVSIENWEEWKVDLISTQFI